LCRPLSFTPIQQVFYSYKTLNYIQIVEFFLWDEDDETDAIIGGTTVAKGQHKYMVRIQLQELYSPL
jgi:hypothetical protein